MACILRNPQLSMTIPSRSDVDRNRWFWSRKRRLVLARDNHRCQLGIPGICTTAATEVDHVRPRAVGGDDAFDNLRSVCHGCHLSRGMDESGRSPTRYSYGASHVVTRRY
jgi:5-methylcytosine-specific restriction endonuclease McrA